METFTVEKFAKELGLPVSLLLEQLKGAGVTKANFKDDVSEEDKSALLNYLRNEHGGNPKPKAKITLTRKQNTEIRKTDSEGRARTIQVEVRKKRTLLKPQDIKSADDKVKKLDNSVKPLPVIDDNQRNIRENEAKRHSALAEAQAADAKSKKNISRQPKVRKKKYNYLKKSKKR